VLQIWVRGEAYRTSVALYCSRGTKTGAGQNDGLLDTLSESITLKGMPPDITLEQLAQMIQRGFEHTSTKEDFKRLEGRLDDVDNRFDGVERRLDSIEYELKEIKTVLGPLVRTVAVMEMDIHDLQSRVQRLEKKAGLQT
jgi:septal ring factor EnvC (AmiA/AmiB activator)